MKNSAKNESHFMGPLHSYAPISYTCLKNPLGVNRFT